MYVWCFDALLKTLEKITSKAWNTRKFEGQKIFIENISLFLEEEKGGYLSRDVGFGQV